MVALILALAVGFALQRFIRSASDWGRTGLAFLGASVALTSAESRQTVRSSSRQPLRRTTPSPFALAGAVCSGADFHADLIL